MKRIVFVHQASTVGGGSYCLLNLLKAVDRSQFEPVALLKDDGPLVDEIEKLDIRVELMPSMDVAPYNTSFKRPGTWVTYLSALLSRRAFRIKMVELNPDILYLNNSMLYPYLSVAKKMGIKTVIHVREHWPLEEHKVQLSWLQNNVRKYADRVVAINRYSAKMVNCPEKNIAMVYDWIDFSNRYKEHDLNMIFGEEMTDKKLYLYTGGMQPIKGCKEVLTTFTRIKNEDARLLALGVDGSQPDVNAIIAHDKRIVCMPAVYELKDLLEKCYCVLSFFTIPHANLALAEAVTLKVPVISAKTDESDEYSDGGHLAVLFEMNNLHAFEDKIKHFEEERKELKTRLEESSVKIALKFNKEINEQVFRDVLSGFNDYSK